MATLFTRSLIYHTRKIALLQSAVRCQQLCCSSFPTTSDAVSSNEQHNDGGSDGKIGGVGWVPKERSKRVVKYRKLLPPKPRPGMRLLEAAVVGLPNAGKSAITNKLISADVCATATKPNTTRANILAAFTRDDSQVVLLDTPGLLRSSLQRKLKRVVNSEPKLVTDCELAVQRSNMVVVVFDASDYRAFITACG